MFKLVFTACVKTRENIVVLQLTQSGNSTNDRFLCETDLATEAEAAACWFESLCSLRLVC